jgi:hypothetical protein
MSGLDLESVRLRAWDLTAQVADLVRTQEMEVNKRIGICLFGKDCFVRKK